MSLSSTTFGGLITFTRSSVATRFNSSGILESVGVDLPRFDYDPITLSPRGLLMETTRTNSIRNNTMVGAAAGTPGTVPTNWFINSVAGVSTSVIGAGTENGINYVDVRWFGTATATGNLRIQPEANSTTIAASNGQIWTFSQYIKLQAGSVANISSFTIAVDELTSGGGFLASSSSSFSGLSNVGLGKYRPSQTRTLVNGTAGAVCPYIFMSVSNGAVVDITLRIGLPQMEQGAFPTSVILTSTVAAVRSQETASINTLSPWFNATEGTIYLSHMSNGVRTSITDSQTLFLSDGTANNFINLRYYTGNPTNQFDAIITAGNVSQVDTPEAGFADGVTVKHALAYKANDVAYSRNGSAAVVDTSCQIPSGLIRLDIAKNPLSQYIQAIKYFPRRLSNAELQALTS